MADIRLALEIDDNNPVIGDIYLEAPAGTPQSTFLVGCIATVEPGFLSNPDPNATTPTPMIATTVNLDGIATFRNVTQVENTTLAPIQVPVAFQVVGSGVYTIGPNELVIMVSGPSGWDSITNPSASVSGVGDAVAATELGLAVANDLYTSLQLFQGEWFLDQTQGIPYYQRILGQKISIAVVTQIFRQAIMQRPGISQILTFQISRDSKRQMFLNFSVLLQDGTILQSSDYAPLVISGVT